MLWLVCGFLHRSCYQKLLQLWWHQRMSQGINTKSFLQQIIWPMDTAWLAMASCSCSPHGIFHLSDPSGVNVIRNCQERGFHPHEEPSNGSPIYEHCSHVYFNSKLKFDVVDLRWCGRAFTLPAGSVELSWEKVKEKLPFLNECKCYLFCILMAQREICGHQRNTTAGCWPYSILISHAVLPDRVRSCSQSFLWDWPIPISILVCVIRDCTCISLRTWVDTCGQLFFPLRVRLNKWARWILTLLLLNSGP